MLSSRKNILYQLGFVLVFSFVFFVSQSQSALAGVCTGVCIGATAQCPTNSFSDTANTLDCILSTPKCCVPCANVTPAPAGCPGANGGGAQGASASIQFTNPIGDPASPDGTNNSTLEGVLGSVLGVLRGIIVVLALVFIVIGAVMYVTSAGNDERMTTAKGAITAAMIGLALAIAAPSFLKQIASILGWTNVDSSLAATAVPTLTETALKVLRFLLSVIGILGIIMLVIGGLAYLTSAGDEERAGTGKKIVTYAIIGIAVALASLIIVTQVSKLFV